MTTLTKYRISLMESERGWGQDYWKEYYDTPEEARARLDSIKKRNEEEYARTKRVPDWYMQAVNDDIVVVQMIEKSTENTQGWVEI